MKEIALKIGDKLFIVRDRTNIRLTRNYPLLVRIVDSASGRENLGIYELSVIFNGRNILNFKCDFLSFSKGRLNIGGRGFDDLFGRKGYYKGKGGGCGEGRDVFKVSASDYSGNQTEKEFIFNVKL